MRLVFFTFVDRKIKYRLIILISAILVTSAILGTTLGFIFLTSTKPYWYETCYGNICCKYQVSPCKGDGTPEINVATVNNQITFDQIVYSYCSPSFKDPKNFGIDLSLLADNITVREIYTITINESITTCVCSNEIKGIISGIPPGYYNLTFLFVNNIWDQISIEVLKIIEIVIQ
jgi:hypothetical protein